MVEALGKAISLRVVGGCSALFDATNLTEFSDEMAFKVATLISMLSYRKSIVLDYLLPEYFGNCACLLVTSWERLGIFSEMVCDDQYVLIATFASF